MMEQIKRWISMTCLVFFVTVCISTITYADFPTLQVKLPADWPLETQKVIFSEDGRKMVALLQEPKQDVRKTLAIALYDLKEKQWTKIVELPGGIQWEIEPLALNVDGRYLAYRHRETIILYDTVKQVKLKEITGAGSMTRAAFAYGSRYLAFLQNAEWEVPTSLAVFDFYATDPKESVQTLVKYSKSTKATGPLQWDTAGTLYFVEEYTYGSVNPEGILKQYIPGKKKAYEHYNTKSKSTRVSNFAISTDRQYRILVLRELDKEQMKSTYGILIQKNGQFVHAAQLQNWTDAIQNWTTKEIGSIGWVGNQYAYWIERTRTGSNLNIFQVDEKKIVTSKYDQQVYLSPTGVILIMER